MKIISMISIRGGSGKSVLSVNFANDLSKKGFKVLLVEADFLAPNLIYAFPELINNTFWNDFILDKVSNIDDLVWSSNLLFDVIPTKPHDDEILTKLQDSDIWKKMSKSIATFISQMKEKYDYLIFDNQGGRFLSTITHAFFSDYLICVIRPEQSTFKATIDYLNLFKSNFYVVWNQILNDERIVPILDTWEKQIEKLPNFKRNLGHLHFNEAAAYEMWYDGNIIPANSNFRKEIEELVANLITD